MTCYQRLEFLGDAILDFCESVLEFSSLADAEWIQWSSVTSTTAIQPCHLVL